MKKKKAAKTSKAMLKPEPKKAPKKTKTAKRVRKDSWTDNDVASLLTYSRKKTPVDKVAKKLGRTIGAVRQRAWMLDIPLGQRA